MSLGTYASTGSADAARVRLAGWLDAAAALAVAMVAWPFPVLRQALPWSVHGPLILVAILVADTAFRTVSLLVWRRTPVMYLLDLGVEGAAEVSAGAAIRWAIGWTAALLPSLLGARTLVHPETGLPARMSGLVTRSTA